MAPPKGRRKTSMVKSKPHQCLFCSKVYQQYQILESHTNLHTGELPYECQDCGETFAYFSYLQRHQSLVHLGQRFHCKLCSASYAGNQDLRSHMDRIHYGKKYICEGCQTQYSSHVTLKRHRDGGVCRGVKKILFSIKMRNLKEKKWNAIQKGLKKEVKPQINRKLALKSGGKETGSGRGTKKIPIKSRDSNGSKGRNARTPKTAKIEIKMEILRKSKTKDVTKKEILKKAFTQEPPKRRRISRKPIEKTRDLHVSKVQTKSADISKKTTSSKNIKVLSSKKKTSPGKPIIETKDIHVSKMKTKSADISKENASSKTVNVPKSKSSRKPVVSKVLPKKGQFKCSLCPTSHSDRNLLWRHASECHGRQIFECRICQNVYTEPCNMYRHMKTAHQDAAMVKRDTKCVQCGLMLESYSLLLEHKKDKHNLKMFKCPHCPNEYTAYSNMFRHRKSHEKKDALKVTPRVYTTAVKSTRKRTATVVKMSSSVLSPPLETFPVISMGVVEKPADSSDNLSVYDKVLQLSSKLRNEQNQNDEMFFLHLNRYDPSSI